MGTVWRARDLSGGRAAVKVLHELLRGELAKERFAREASVLEALQHPGIVRWLAHGENERGEPWLAMEWLEGEDLAARLERAPLTAAESVALVVRVAEALALAHAAGVVHRDVKPSNVFLVDRDLARPKLLDFGVARHGASARPLTRTGAVMGTPGYMAPEQARGDRDVDVRADVFSLGCVLFECLTGCPPFVGEHPVAVLAKILLEDAPRPSELVELPPALDDFCLRTLAKDPADRPADAGQLAEELRALAPLGEARRKARSVRAPSLGGGEQRLLSVLLAEAEDLSSAQTMARDAPDLVRQVVASYGGRRVALADGTVVVVLEEPEVAVACALALRALLPGRRMALATGRAELGDRLPVGEAIDRAARLYATASPSTVRLDELTAALTAGRYDVRGGVLGGPRAPSPERVLLGKPAPCVGRDAEIGLLEAALRACADEGTARAVVVTGPAGIGKSRLRHEIGRRIGGEASMWIARGEPMGAGAALGLIAQLLRAEAGVAAGEPIGLRQAKMREWVTRRVAASEGARVAEVLCEVVGAPIDEARASVRLRSARQDAAVMSEQVRRAWGAVVEGETASRALLVVLEDVHWADAASVALVDEALRQAAERPLMVLALGRPETFDRFPGLFEARGAQRVKLGPLARRPAEKLVRVALGEDAAPERVAALVERAAGNAFFLEELVRAAAEGRDETPETVLAMLLARMGRMESEARRVLRAASVFGDIFWQGGVRALCGEARSTDTDGWLAELVRREVITPRGVERFAGEPEYAFRHSLVREAAYGMLTPDDRSLAHRLAGEWLERAGETEGAVLAGHFERGADPVGARRWLVRAAEQSLDAGDHEGVIAAAERAVALGATSEDLGALRLLEAEARHWLGQRAQTERAAAAAMRLLGPGSDAWLEAAGQRARAAGSLGHRDHVLGAAEALLAHPASGSTFAANAALAARACFAVGHSATGAALIERALQIDGLDARARGRVCSARATQAQARGDAASFLALQLAALEAWEEAGDHRVACVVRVNVGVAYLELGCYAESERVLQEALTISAQMGLANVVAGARDNLGIVLARRGRLDEARRVETLAAEAFRELGDRRLEGGARVYLAQIHLLAGELEHAEREARTAAALLEAAPPLRPSALAILAEVLLARGDASAALASAREAAAVLEAAEVVESGEAPVRLALARALDATGDREAARAALAVARARLEARAGAISDPALRRSFLENVPEHAATFELARRWA